MNSLQAKPSYQSPPAPSRDSLNDLLLRSIAVTPPLPQSSWAPLPNLLSGTAPTLDQDASLSEIIQEAIDLVDDILRLEDAQQVNRGRRRGPRE
jgi:hypothetical protein